MKRLAREIIEKVLNNKIRNAKELQHAKTAIAKRYGYRSIIKNSEILHFASKNEREKLQLLTKKPVRTISGVSVVAVMCKPGICPGDCIYCPTTLKAPKSYTGEEPAALRARMFKFDAYEQVSNRIKQLEAIGHKTSKVELIVMGGTFPSFTKKYKQDFILSLFNALNEKKARSLEDAHRLNEKAKNRCVGLTIETRPDFCTKENINEFLSYGATRIELGVQTLSDEIYKKVSRGHTLKDVEEATKNLKNAGFKVCYHYMPGLLANEKQDLRMFKALFTDERFKPDMIKIYPTLVVKNTGLYGMWKNKKYRPLTNEKAVKLIAQMKTFVPTYCRIMRIQRDIPSFMIEAGVTAGNLRELVLNHMHKNKMRCNCIRCREAGHAYYKKKVVPKKLSMEVEEYNASNGHDFFISIEDKKLNLLLGYVRLRFPSESIRKEIDNETALIRELKVVGVSLLIGEKSEKSFQHGGIGKQLMKKAEAIAKEHKKKKIVVISAVGTREYYKKLGYKKEGPYMSRKLN